MSPKLLNILLLAISGVLYFFVIAPLYTGEGTSLWTPESGIVQLRVDKVKYVQTLDQVDQIVAQAEQLKKEYATLTDEERTKLAIMIPDSVDKVRLYSEVINIANTAGITLNGMNLDDLKSFTNPNLSAYDLSFSVRSTYPRFKEIMRYFENSLRLFSTESVNFSAPAKETDAIMFNVRMRTYYMK